MTVFKHTEDLSRRAGIHINSDKRRWKLSVSFSRGNKQDQHERCKLQYPIWYPLFLSKGIHIQQKVFLKYVNNYHHTQLNTS